MASVPPLSDPAFERPERIGRVGTPAVIERCDASFTTCRRQLSSGATANDGDLATTVTPAVTRPRGGSFREAISHPDFARPR
jgi:hypothetical protein